MAGLVPAIHEHINRQSSSIETAIQVRPIGVLSLYQINLPLARPFLERFFAGNRQLGLLKLLQIDKSVNLYRFVKPSTTSLLCCHMRLARLPVTPMYKVPCFLLARMYR